MERDHEVILPTHEGQRRHVCREGDGRTRDAGARVGSGSEFGIRQLAGVAARPACVGAVDDLVERFRGHVVAEPIAAHVRGPRPAGCVIDPDAHRVAQAAHGDPLLAGGRQAADGRSPLVTPRRTRRTRIRSRAAGRRSEGPRRSSSSGHRSAARRPRSRGPRRAACRPRGVTRYSVLSPATSSEPSASNSMSCALP